MLWREKEQWPFNMGRGEKGHIEGKVAIILSMEIICKDVNLYFLITAHFCLHVFQPICFRNSFSFPICFLLNNTS